MRSPNQVAVPVVISLFATAALALSSVAPVTTTLLSGAGSGDSAWGGRAPLGAGPGDSGWGGVVGAHEVTV